MGAMIAAIGLPLCYLIWVLKGCRPWMPFISDFDLAQPEAALFSILGTLGPLFISAGMFYHFRDRLMHLERTPSHRAWWFLEFITLGLGLCCCASVIAIVHLTWTDYLTLHGLLATLFFYGGTAWVVTLSLGTWHSSRSNERLLSLLKLRIMFGLFALIGLIGMITQISIYFGSSSFSVEEYVAFGRDFERFCRTTVHPSINSSAAFEWLLVTSVISVAMTLAYDHMPASDVDSVE
ncbi:MAG TPA: hypothetical protein QF646_05680 [Candidatus Poseidoniales archaeon]|nr:hypothetical protein [Candidatus Poseidoniales archaeon]